MWELGSGILARRLPISTVMRLLFLISTLVLTSSCVRDGIGDQPTTVSVQQSPSPTASPLPTQPPEKIDTQLQTDLAKIAEAAKGRVGVGAVLMETGDAAYLEREGHFPMQSVYKLPIAMAVLKLVTDGKVRIDQEISITPDDFVRQGFHSPIRNANPQGTVMNVYGIMRYSISESDGTASDVLLDLAGGPAAVMEYLKGIGVSDLIVADSEKSISKDWETQYRNWSTPQASVKLLNALQNRQAGLNEQMTTLLLKFMTETETGDRRLKRGLPEAASVAHKTGTGGTEKGITGATNDIGIITLPDGRHIFLAVYVSDSPESGAVREKVIADVARAVIERWSPDSTKAAQSTVSRSRCATAKSSDELRLCDAVLSKADREDDPTYQDFEVVSTGIDLNADGEKETVAWISSWSGTSGASLIVLSEVKDGYRRIWEGEMTWTPIIALDSKSNGWTDLSFVQTGGGAKTGYVIVKHNGRAYRRSGFQENQPQGKVLIAKDWQQSTFGPIK